MRNFKSAVLALEAWTHDVLDLVDREVRPADRQRRRSRAEIDAVDGTLHGGGDRDRVAAGVLRADRHFVIAVRPLRAVVALAVPIEVLLPGIEREGARIGKIAGR